MCMSVCLCMHVCVCACECKRVCVCVSAYVSVCDTPAVHHGVTVCRCQLDQSSLGEKKTSLLQSVEDHLMVSLFK